MAQINENVRVRGKKFKILGPSQRILMRTAFSTFVNTEDDPVCLDLDTPIEQATKAYPSTSKKKKTTYRVAT
ncbi:hypothetical protein L6452_14422 [Arctium lappa]|uniref:Uncharacterized protein n=1 Tax=Arctium lappa TaxID=4217 RepID=A0ACB9CL17_ARCLA|nr:hypothetical protein L6452_14422 [Arctium lappa]